MEEDKQMSVSNTVTVDDSIRHDDKKEIRWWWLVGFLVLVLALWFGTLYLTPRYYQPPENSGTFGDMFGSVNALFSGLAFAGLLFAILLQRKELQLQRQELEEARVQFRRQADQLEAQARTSVKQTFEDTFFRMLGLLAKQADEMTTYHRRTLKPLTGHDALSYLYSEFKRSYSEEETPEGSSRIEEAFGILLASTPQLTIYFGTLVHTLSLLDKSDVGDKVFYGTFMSSQLFQHEKCLLFYCALLNGMQSTKVRIEKYSVLYRIDRRELVQLSHFSLYNAGAWNPVNEPSPKETVQKAGSPQ